MPVCFCLIDKETEKGVSLQTVDNEMREFFNVPPSATEWYKNWYNFLGIDFAIYGNFEKPLNNYPELSDVINYLESRYTIENWRE